MIEWMNEWMNVDLKVVLTCIIKRQFFFYMKIVCTSKTVLAIVNRLQTTQNAQTHIDVSYVVIHSQKEMTGI